MRDWEKILIGLGKLWLKARFISVVSSHAPCLATGGKSYEGRMMTFVLPPLIFLAFLRCRGSENFLFNADSKSIAQEINRSTLSIEGNRIPALDTEFEYYINFGGFVTGIPLLEDDIAVSRPITNGIAVQLLRGDFPNLHGISEVLKLGCLFALFAFNTACEITIDYLAKATKMIKNSLRKYLDYLERAFLIHRVPRVDKNPNHLQRQVALKVYLTAPYLSFDMFALISPTGRPFCRLAGTTFVAQWLASPDKMNFAYAPLAGRESRHCKYA
ncbi:MAG: hypothetical protein CBB68_06130 [Rhodospirillaceae bacterium TMED8]|nr:hypothetical protein [Magnetovibrio sp.]OUT51200.1 MAG: hypothetical protein CBB68_06130 [Rhodospirillaceae bacterium TMED8]|tara:strand:- start:36 stop:851 length:816 start_codon:yes stop_codon:yes gene_type:complete